MSSIEESGGAHQSFASANAERQRIASTLGQILWVTSPDGKREWLSDSFSEYTGSKIDELTEGDWLLFLDQQDRRAAAARWQQAVDSGIACTVEVRLRRHDGERRWHTVTTAPFVDDTGEIVRWYGSATDTHDRRSAELLRNAQSAILDMISSGAGLSGVLLAAATAAYESTGAATCINLVEGGRLRPGAAPGVPAAIISAIDGMHIGPTAGSCGTAAHRRGPVVVTDIATDPLWADYRDLVLPHGLVACWSAPVFAATGEVVATFAQYFTTPRAPSPDELRTCDEWIRLVTLAIDRVRAVEAMERQTSLAAIASRIGRLGGWAWDIRTLELIWSDGVRTIHDLAPGTPIDRKLAVSFWAPEYRSIMHSAIDACRLEGRSWSLDIEIITALGRQIWVRTEGEAVRDGTGDIVAIHGAIQDITESRANESALRESEERFRLAMQATSDIVWDYDVETGSVWRSEGMAALLGLDGTLDPTAEGWQKFVHPDDVGLAEASFRRMLASGDDYWTTEYRVVRVDGSVATVAEHSYIMRRPDGSASRVVGSTVDRTRERQLEAQLEQSQRLEAVGQLTGGVAHDFNNLLTVVLGNAELLLDMLDVDDSRRENVEMVRTAAEQGAELIDRLLAFARRQPLDPKVVDVDALLARLGPLLRRTLGGEIEIDVIWRPDTWAALIDGSQLESAMVNLCINARDAMPRGGRLVIETSNVSLDEHDAALNSEVAAGEYVMVSVSDTGDGMSPDVLKHAFDPFFTTKSVGRGSGLGLSMVYGFTRQSQGHVSLNSEPGEGTTVRLYLPRSLDDAPEIQPAADVSIVHGTERILLVEDDDMVRTHARALLEGLGYHVIVAADARAALAAIDGGAEIDLLFTDVVMPGGMNGRELAAQVNERLPNLPVLFTSGYAENALVHDGRLDGGVHLLTKPYRLPDLAAQLRLALAG